MTLAKRLRARLDPLHEPPPAAIGVPVEFGDDPPDPTRVAVIVCHGMGQQVRFQTLNDVVQVVRDEARRRGERVDLDNRLVNEQPTAVRVRERTSMLLTFGSPLSPHRAPPVIQPLRQAGDRSHRHVGIDGQATEPQRHRANLQSRFRPPIAVLLVAAACRRTSHGGAEPRSRNRYLGGRLILVG